MLEVFISHSSKDMKYVEIVKTNLGQEFGLRVSYDFLPTGIRWSEQIDYQLSSSNAVIVILTPNSVQSRWVTYEWSYALGRGIPVLPLKFEQFDKNDIHDKLAAIQFVSFIEAPPETWERLRNDILRQAVGSAIDRVSRISMLFMKKGLSWVTIHGALNELLELRPQDMSLVIGMREAIVGFALTEEQYDVREKAALLIGKIKHRGNYEVLIKLLKTDEHRSVRAAAAKALGALGDKRAIPELIVSLQDERSVRAAAISSLGDLRAVEAQDHLISFLDDGDVNIVLYAIRALSKLGKDGAKAVPKLIELLDDTSQVTSMSRICDGAALALRLIRDPVGLTAVAQWELSQRFPR